MSTTTTGLVARTSEIDATTAALPEPEEVAGADGLLWRDPELALAGVGVAMRIDLPYGLDSVGTVAPALAGVEMGGGAFSPEGQTPGAGVPIALGALPFDRRSPGHLVVPSVLVGRAGGRRWVTTVSPPGAEVAVPAAAAAGVADPPDGFALSSPMSHRDWKALVADAIERVQRGEMAKVVVARKVEVEANRPFLVPDVVSRLISLYPSCTIFSVEGLLGASPELLVRRQGETVTCVPLAGTVARSGDTASDNALIAGLLASPKQRREHRLVVEALADQLAPLCSELDVPSTPSIVGLRNVSHLASPIRGRLAGPAPFPTALELAALLHPTPAVGGVPRQTALGYLQACERLDRGRYAGPVGWVDANGDGAFAVAIRCAEVDGNRATLFAGSGVVDGSDPAGELAESQLKLQALLAALVRP